MAPRTPCVRALRSTRLFPGAAGVPIRVRFPPTPGGTAAHELQPLPRQWREDPERPRELSMTQEDGALRSIWTTVAGLPMHARIGRPAKPDAGPAMVLVHGLGVSGRYMLPTARRLVFEHPTYVPDLPGFG